MIDDKRHVFDYFGHVMSHTNLHSAVVPHTYVQLLYEHLDELGVDAEALLGSPRPQGVGRYPVLRWREHLQRAAEALHDPLLGLHLGQRISPRHLGVLGYVLLACGSVAGALQRMERYHRLIYDVNPMQLQHTGDHVDLCWSAENGRPGALVDETAIAALLQFCRDITNQPDASPMRVEFINPRPADIGPYERWFGCPVSFDHQETRVSISLSLLNTPLRTADPALIAILEEQAGALLDSLEQQHGKDLARQVQQMLVGQLREGPASAARIADELHTSVRHLHRRLAAEGCNFRQLLQQTRQQLANDYLADPRLQLSEVAALLGFSEQSAFSRAFKNWTGLSPAQFRRQGPQRL